ncbi:MAG: putative transporter [Muribaculaceae bacterium]|nr:putative transporter [Muribaculaceae bacterium]
MDWLIELFTGNSVAHSIFIYALVIAIGVVLGNVKIFGVSLGATFVLFIGIVAGHFGLTVEAEILHFIREFGLILFIFAIGLQVGSGFFSSFKQGGIVLNGLAVLLITLNIVVALGIYFCVGGEASVHISDMVGILSGAVTNTPGLGAAQQTLSEVSQNDVSEMLRTMSLGYAAAYPLGVVGIIVSMILVKAIFSIRLSEETEQIDKEKEQSQLKPFMITLKVENKFIFGLTIKKLLVILDRDFVISRMKRKDGTIIVPVSATTIEEGDLLYMVISAQEKEVYEAFFGPSLEMDWENDETSPVVSRRIVITNGQYTGKKLGTLRLHMGYQLNATRVNRAGMELIASPNLSLQVGDRLTVVGKEEDINKLASEMGNSMKRLDHPNLFTMFIGIVIGIIFGSIPISLPGMTVPMKLGVAGGPLVIALLISRWGYKLKLVTYTSNAASLMLREIGICLFLASVGIAAGGEFVATVFNAQGLTWVLYGFLITFIPMMVVGCIARGKFKINYYSIMGLLSGASTDPPALAYANRVANNDAPAVAYSTVYPLTMFLRIVTAQILILISPFLM